MKPSGIDEQTSGEPNPLATSRISPRTRLIAGIVGMLVGCLLLLGGIILHIGEKAGRLLIFPSAGRLTMLVGLASVGIGAATAGRRAAIMLSGLMVIVGIILYVVGLVFVEQLGTRLYQAFGLLTTLVGLFAIYGVFRMGIGGTSDELSRMDKDG